MPTWPATLPDFRLPLSAEHQDGRIRTDMDSGPAKMRLKFTAVAKYYTGVQIRLKGSELLTLEDFYYNTLAGGVLEFTKDDLISGESSTFRFRSPYTSQQRTGAETASERVWDVQFDLEKMP